MYRKSLDHMGLAAKNADKKLFAAKTILDSIKTKYEEQDRLRKLKSGASIPRVQFTFTFDDHDVILDAVRLMVIFAEDTSQYNGAERERAIDFFGHFASSFFGIPRDKVHERLTDIARDGHEEEEDAEEQDDNASDLPNGRSKKANGNLLQSMFSKGVNGTKGRSARNSTGPGSKESTPEVGSGVDEEMADTPEDASANEVTNEKWLTSAPTPWLNDRIGAGPKPDSETPAWSVDQVYQRKSFSLFGGQTATVFFHNFELLYRRLKALKDSEPDVIEEVRRARKHKPANDLDLVDPKATEFFTGKDPEISYYNKTLEMIEQFMIGEVEEVDYQTYLRHFYMKKGWGVYTIVDLMKHLCRLGALCTSIDPKEKSADIMTAFFNDRSNEASTFQNVIDYRKHVQKLLKDAEMFQIEWVSPHYTLKQLV
jgi:paired amphipathic helix protein Sin3a